MKKNRNLFTDFTDLRPKAEARLKTREKKIPDISVSQNEMQRIIHELAVHQIELEMQQEELLQSREELEEGLERFTELYDFAPLGYLTLARDGTILQVNLTGTKLIGVDRSELIGDRFGRYVAADELPVFNALLESVFSSSGNRSCEVMLRNDENPQLQPDLSLSLKEVAVPDRIVRIDAVASSDGQECRTVVSDISREKQVERENAELQLRLIQVQKMESIGRLAGGVAHDFNNMLQIMLGEIDLLIEAEGVNSGIREKLATLRMSVLKAAGLPYQLLVFARQQTVEPRVLDCNVAVAEMLNMLRHLIGEDIELVFTPGTDLWPVKIDPSQVDQIIANLAVNSRDAIQGAGVLSIETRNVVVDASYSRSHPESLPGDYVQLVVHDNGRGIDKQTIGSIFEPFFSTKPKVESNGIGLATVYGIVSQNKGFIEVFSQEGEETTFEIYLPRSKDEAVRRGSETEPLEAPRGDETILLVEDDDSVREITGKFLESFGYKVLAASSSSAAIVLAAEYSDIIHMLVTDMIMPGMNGWDLSLEIIKRHPGLKLLFISGYSADAFAQHEVLVQSVNFLGKPFRRIELACKVRDLLDTEAFPGA
ncbi:MAG: response regulator [Chlorobiaceae bacterium]|jgi:two-component system, cell cycle sensor histidine kinase and response regulator CckA|nr:response regulator [Chlorobiaceae bacterium]NTV16917.1 response regulator [Chlorobiaceae bacterium]